MSCAPKEFLGKVALITGASSGLGACTAIHLASLGASVALTGRNLENLKAVAAKCAFEGQPKPLIIQADLTKEEDVKNIVESTIKYYKKINILINNAGVFSPSNIQSTNLKHFDTIFNTNVRAVYFLTSLAVPHIIAAKGCIIQVSGVAGMRAFPQILTSCMGKAALDQFTKCIAMELAPLGVRVNSVNPGVIQTEVFVHGGMTEKETEAFYERCKSTHPLGRIGQPQEVANAIAFLASDKSSFITGELLPVDGGKHALCPR